MPLNLANPKPFDQVPIDLNDPIRNTDLTISQQNLQADQPQDQIALCLSGGGYRAMIFHLGPIIRLNELGALKLLSRVSSVSGGSITAAQLALAWNRLEFNSLGVATNLDNEVVQPIRKLAGQNIDIYAAILGLVGLSSSDYVASCYGKTLFGNATLQDFPDPQNSPLFILNATSLQTATLWRFCRLYMADYLVGKIDHPKLRIAKAVAASSAFPPFLSPAIFQVTPTDFTPVSPPPPLFKPPYNEKLILTDGGVYDNLGLETAWKACKTVLVSDGGLKWGYDPKPSTSWLEQLTRVFTTEDNQIRSLRLRQIMTSYQMKIRDGCYWGIRTNITSYPIPPALPYSPVRQEELENVGTRLAYMESSIQERLINLGYLASDSAFRSYGASALVRRGIKLQPPTQFPYAIGI